MSIKAYQRAATQADQPRDLEYRAFGLVTAGLVRVKEGNSPITAVPRRSTPIAGLNVLSADCADLGNQLLITLAARSCLGHVGGALFQ
jgi:hypothetical protein